MILVLSFSWCSRNFGHHSPEVCWLKSRLNTNTRGTPLVEAAMGGEGQKLRLGSVPLPHMLDVAHVDCHSTSFQDCQINFAFARQLWIPVYQNAPPILRTCHCTGTIPAEQNDGTTACTARNKSNTPLLIIPSPPPDRKSNHRVPVTGSLRAPPE